MENDISQTKDSLQQFDSSDKSPSGTLAVLDEEYSSFWQGPGLNEMAAELGLRERRFVAIDKEQAAALIKGSHCDAFVSATPILIVQCFI